MLGNNINLTIKFRISKEDSMSLNTTIFEKNDFKEVIRKLEELLTHSKIVLLGAGASFCAGLPLTNKLTEEVLKNESLSTTSKEILKAIQSKFKGANPAAHIEDYLSELIDWLAITARRFNRNVDDNSISIDKKRYEHDQLLKAVEEIKLAIFSVINKDVTIDTHIKFIESLHRPIRPGKKSSECIDYLVMNYDTLIEDALALSRIKYADGLEGGVSGWWNPDVFEKSDLEAKVLKLHGSINWSEDPSSFTPFRVNNRLNFQKDPSAKIMIWPASTKYRETQLDPYAYLMHKARGILNPQNGKQKVLLISGYSFGDSHINLEIERGLKNSKGNLTVLAFISDNEPTGIIKDWNNNPDINKQLLIFANKGFYHADQQIISENDIKWWKFENLTQILEGRI